MHSLSAILLLILAIVLSLGYFFYIGWFIAVILLIYENRLVNPNDLSKAVSYTHLTLPTNREV